MGRAILAMAALLALAACGPKPKPAAAPPQTAGAQASGLDISALDGHIIAVGTNPNWRLDEDAKAGFVLTIGDQTVSAPHAAPSRDGAGARMASRDITLSLNSTPCTHDGVAYPMTATVQHGQGAALQGCAVVRWDKQLLALLPEIDACLAQATEPMSVVYAAPERDGAFVRLKLEDDAFDCHASRDPNVQATMDAASDQHYASENDVIFVRAPGDNPGGDCYQAPEVRGADGTLLGWLDDQNGC